ncbi:sulfite exporter TauE/SafE family protein [Rhabdaerophilum sp. SD176]|uniref:sulfite exporter TauE/SafE family protein n=1 Tax=Rhabdaerophilum sp. SD176 TaxID=2983548 RepID=UPI0024DF93B6|nr:sulfite exporter TauE/SafE family protein [Rhabdaerophilum sp. SD176]
MLAALSSQDWLVVALGAALGGLTRGFTGFGFAMIFMPLAASVLPPHVALAVIWAIDAPFALVLGLRAYRAADKKGVLTLLAAAALMFPVGLYALIHVDALVIRWIISGLVMAAVVILASGWRYHGRPGLPLTLSVGSLSGLFNGLASLSGLPLALFWLSSQNRQPAEIRADMQTYFLFSTFVSGAILGYRGILTVETLLIALSVMPAYGAMLYLGTRGYHMASEATFRRIAYAIVALAAILSLPALDGWIR